MMHRTSFSIILFACLIACMALSLLNTGPFNIDIVNTVYAAQRNTKEEALQNNPGKISGMVTGKVTEIITAAGFTYAEVDTGKEKVWAAAPGVTPLKKGDMTAFSTEMPMQNFHSKTLGRDFSIIYFVKSYITDKETAKESSAIATPHGQINNQQISKLNTTTDASGEVRVGGYLREARLDGLNGKKKKLSDLKGKPLIINIWASWCGPCRAEMGSLERLSNRYNSKEFNVIGISTDDYRNKAMAFIEQTGITFENFMDNRRQLENMLGANAIPLTILVDSHGRVLEKVRGAREWDSPKIIEGIGKAFNIKLMN